MSPAVIANKQKIQSAQATATAAAAVAATATASSSSSALDTALAQLNTSASTISKTISSSYYDTVQNRLDTATSNTQRTHMLKNEIENSANPVLADCYANENDKTHEIDEKSNENEAQTDGQDTATDGTTLATKLSATVEQAATENNNSIPVACSNECQLSSAQTQQQQQLQQQQQEEQAQNLDEQQQQLQQEHQQQVTEQTLAVNLDKQQQPPQQQQRDSNTIETVASESSANTNLTTATAATATITTTTNTTTTTTTLNDTTLAQNTATVSKSASEQPAAAVALTPLETPAGSGNSSPRRKSSVASSSKLKLTLSSARGDEDTLSKSSDTSSYDLPGITAPVNQDSTANVNADKLKSSGSSRLSERAKKKSWYNVLYPNYKARSEDFKKLFKEVPNDERLIVEYSCALQRDILVQGRLYVSQNYVCFHANIFRWETYVCLKWKDVTAITKEKTALVIPNAILICTAKEKYFFATFTSRDKSFLMLFRVWQNTLMNKQMQQHEIWQWIHNCYGDELGLTSDDEDYIDPTSVPIEGEIDLDFASVLEDSSSQKSSNALCANSDSVSAILDYNTANSNSNQSINQIGGSGAQDRNQNRNSSSPAQSIPIAQSGTHSGSGSSGGVKSKTRSYFFGSRNNSASASGSDNKASDVNSHSVRGSGSSKGQMKVNAKELTLESIKPSLPSNGMADTKDTKDSKTTSGGGGGGGGGGSSRKAQQTSKHNRPPRDESANRTSELSPTDNSDSSDSDENKAPFVSTAECTSTHEGRQFMHTILPIHIDTLFNLLFSKSKFLVDFHDMRKSTDMTFGDWTLNEEGRKQRIVNVTVQLAASVGPKTSKVTEMQEMRECSKPGELYSIDINSVNAGIPYADSFSVLLHYCLVRTVDDHTMLSVHGQIKYKKSIWGVVKGFIEKNTWAGLEDFFVALLHALQNETCIPMAKGKGRRPRRGTASQIRPLEELPTPQAKAEPCESATIVSTLPAHVPVKAPTIQLASSERGGKTKWLSIFVIVMLCFLIVLNAVLLLKLWKLEERIEDDLVQRSRMPNLSSLKKLPNTHQEWIDLLRQQEILHETELKRWHTVLQTAIELLRKTEKTLAALLFR